MSFPRPRDHRAHRRTPALDPRRARDAQRSRVYRAESAVPSSPLPGLPACARLPSASSARSGGRCASRTAGWARCPGCDPATVPARRSIARIPADPRSRSRAATAPRASCCTNSCTGRSPREHELPHHGSTFARVLLDATAEFCGPERAELLLAAYAEQKVRVGKPAAVDDRSTLQYGDDERNVWLAEARSTQRRRERDDATRAAVDRFNEAFNRHDVDAVMAAMTEDCVFESTSPPHGERFVGHGAVRACVGAVLRRESHRALRRRRDHRRPATAAWCAGATSWTDDDGAAAQCAASTSSPSATAASPRSSPTSKG